MKYDLFSLIFSVVVIYSFIVHTSKIIVIDIK